MPSHADETSDAAARLQSMVETPQEVRSIETGSGSITAASLDSIMLGAPTRAGVYVNEESALTIPAVFAAISIISRTAGMLPLAVYKGDDDDRSRVRDTSHPAYRLLRHGPNAEMTAATFKETVTRYMVGWGNGYCRIIRNNSDQPVALLPIHPARVRPERYAGQVRYVVSGDGGIFAPEEILHIPALGDGLVGLSPVAVARDSLGAGKAAELTAAAFWANGAKLDGYLKTAGRLSPEATARLREGWTTQHAGVGNNSKTAILQDGVTYEKIGLPPEEMQFLETRKFSVNQVAMIFGIPAHMLGDLDRATHSNIEQQGLEFLVYTMGIWLEKWEQETTRKLCGYDTGHYCRFDDRRLLRSDMAARQQFYGSMRQWGAYSANDIRRDEGMEPIEGGDTYLSPVNMMPANQIDKPDPETEASDAVRSVFEDAIGRMLRKELKAQGNGKADEGFYADHAGHVREALAPAVDALHRLLHVPLSRQSATRSQQVMEQFARERRSTSENELPAVAAQRADQIIRQLMEARKGQQ